MVECVDGLARITSKELAITHFVKGAYCTRPRAVVGLGKSAHSHTVRLTTSRRKGPKKNDDKSAVALLKKGDWHERGPVTDQCRDRSGNLGREAIRNWDRSRLNVNHLMHGNWVAFFKT